MKNNDVTLIQRILEGDEVAFESLIRKYQKQVHAHAWRRIRDFHIAEDITQETFLQVYQKLETLGDPTQFQGWIHKVVKHLCIAWFRKNPLQTESLEETDISESEIEKAVETLVEAKLASHTEDNLIGPKNDAIFYYLNFVGMTRVHLDPKDH